MGISILLIYSPFSIFFFFFVLLRFVCLEVCCVVLTIDRNYRRLIIGTVQLILLGLYGYWLVGCGIRLLTLQ